jgi:ubiquinone/menaquinone biosynthesis C-methylase UbiE
MSVQIISLDTGQPARDPQALEIFQAQWSVYQRLIENDYLSHAAIAAVLHRVLSTEFAAPFSFLDLACGDAYRMREILAGTPVARYIGVDLSAPALDVAAARFADAPFPHEFWLGDLIEATRGPAPASDVVWCGLCLHHLQTADKLDALRAIRSKTTRLCLIYEPTRTDGESREAFMARFLELESCWCALEPKDWRDISAHVTSCDFPEEASTWLELGRAAGFSTATRPYVSSPHFADLFRFDV